MSFDAKEGQDLFNTIIPIINNCKNEEVKSQVMCEILGLLAFKLYGRNLKNSNEYIDNCLKLVKIVRNNNLNRS